MSVKTVCKTLTAYKLYYHIIYIILKMPLSDSAIIQNDAVGTCVFQILSLEKSSVSDQPSSVQVRSRSSSVIPSASNSSLAQNASSSKNTPKTSGSDNSSKPLSQLPQVSEHESVPDLQVLGESVSSTRLEDSPVRLAEKGRSTSNLAISGSQMNLNNKEPTPSIASDISHPYASQELHHRLKELQK